MYDAINRGFARATGELCAYLNCDEQYLPGSLNQVTAIFVTRPSLDMLFGDAVLADETGPVSYRRVILPRQEHLKKRPLNTPTCATFFRRAIIDRGFLFDPQWKIVGDKAWICHLIDNKITMRTFRQPLSVYFFTG
ncbi:hypothetical protein M8391_14255, partial [Staphylococcus aureus]|nr:hypothetical protein [Staphylococcus aureus]